MYLHLLPYAYTIITAFPDSTLILSPPITYAHVGEQVQLECAIAPGRLIQHYYVTWDVGRQVVYQTKPNESPQAPSDHYDLNAEKYSLIINNVQLKDASRDYHCALTVVDPNTDQNHPYNNLQDVDIGLIVLDHSK